MTYALFSHLQLVLVLFVLIGTAALFVRLRRAKAELGEISEEAEALTEPRDAGRLSPVELGHLAGGSPRAAQVAFVSLLLDGRIELDPRTERVRIADRGPTDTARNEGPDRSDDGPVHRALLRLLAGPAPGEGSEVPVRELLARTARDETLRRVGADLVRRGMYPDHPRALRNLRRLNVSRGLIAVLGAFGAWGALSALPHLLLVGLSADPRFLLLLLGLAVLALALLCGYLIVSGRNVHVPDLTPAGRSALERARSNHGGGSTPGAEDTDALPWITAVNGVHGFRTLRGHLETGPDPEQIRARGGVAGMLHVLSGIDTGFSDTDTGGTGGWGGDGLGGGFGGDGGGGFGGGDGGGAGGGGGGV